MKTTYKFRLYPKKEQEEKLIRTLDICRDLYNYLLSETRKRKIHRYEIQSMLVSLKKDRRELNEVYSKVLQMVVFMLSHNLKVLHRLKKKGNKVGKLRYKKKFKSFIYNQSGFKIIKTGKRLDILRLSKIGDIPIRLHRDIEGNIKQTIIKRYKSGKWFALVCVDGMKNKESENNRIVGIDVGVKYFLTDSDGRHIENPRFYEKLLNRIKIEQRKLSRKNKGSKNWEKQRRKLAKLFEKLVNKRNDFLHKLSKFYAKNYKIICVEDLKIKNMVKNRNLAQKILDVSWGVFIRLLSYKVERTGGMVVKVNPKNTSREYKFGKLDRDYNASLNIMMRGLSGLGQPFVPVEITPLRELKLVPASVIVEAGSPIL